MSQVSEDSAAVSPLPLSIEGCVGNLTLGARKWIAQEFHDSIAQTLSTLSLFINFVEGAQQASRGTRSETAKLLQLSRQLRSDFDYAFGGQDESLTRQIESLLNGLEGRVNWITQLPAEDLHLSPRVQHEVCNIIREGLHNISKHAGATFIYLSITVNDGVVEINLNDNGRGFDLRDIGRNCFGLRGMSERAEALGGVARFTSAPGKGTSLLVRLETACPDDIESGEKIRTCHNIVSALRNHFAVEMAQLEETIKAIVTQPSNSHQHVRARQLVGHMMEGVRGVIRSLRDVESPAIGVGGHFSQVAAMTQIVEPRR